jgi:hypothetical protein
MNNKDYTSDNTYKGYNLSGKVTSIRGTADNLQEATIMGVIVDEDEDGADFTAKWQKHGWTVNIDDPLITKRMELDDTFDDFVHESVQEIFDNYMEKKNRNFSPIDDEDDSMDDDVVEEIDYLYDEEYDPNY